MPWLPACPRSRRETQDFKYALGRVVKPWLHIVGIGAEGLPSLSPAARAIVNAAEVIVGGKRHLGMIDDTSAARIAWPSPFDSLIAQLKEHRGKPVVVLATGDPLWYSVGARIGREIPGAEICYYPQLSAFQHAAARMGWSLADVETLTVHGRPVDQMRPFVQPEQRLLLLTAGAETPAQVAQILIDAGFGASRLTVLSDLGDACEGRFDALARDWARSHGTNIPPLNTLAVECIASADAAVLSRTPGLPDTCFTNDGTMTKQEVRAITLAKLMPMRGALLWDIGTGCGTVAIEWMRAGRDARAIGVEQRADRRAFAAQNAVSLGVPKLDIIDGVAPAACANLPAPDAVFLGGGISQETVATCWGALKPLGRIVANAVTLEAAQHLNAAHAQYGGELVQVQVNRAEPIGPHLGWKPHRPVTQWSAIKR